MKILIAGRDKDAIQSLEAIAAGPARDVETRHISNGHADPLNDIAELPDLLIFHARCGDAAELECLIERPVAQRPDMLVVGPANDPQLMRLALKAGARDYLGDPIDREELLQNLEQIEHEHLRGIGPHNGKMLAIVSAKGGAGASFVAANLAHVLTARARQRVALIDMDLQFACLGQYLDLGSRHGLTPVVEMADELDTVALDAYMSKHESGLSLLGPATDEMVLPGQFPADKLAGFYDLLKENYTTTIVDIPRQIDDVSATTFDKADQILLVIQQDVATIRDAKKLRHMLIGELEVDPGRLTVIVNRFVKNSSVELDDIARSLRVPKEEFVVIPNNYRDVAESINVGVPLLDHSRGSSVTKALMELAGHFTDESEQRRSGLFSRAFSNFLGA